MLRARLEIATDRRTGCGVARVGRGGGGYRARRGPLYRFCPGSVRARAKLSFRGSTAKFSTAAAARRSHPAAAGAPLGGRANRITRPLPTTPRLAAPAVNGTRPRPHSITAGEQPPVALPTPRPWIPGRARAPRTTARGHGRPRRHRVHYGRPRIYIQSSRRSSVTCGRVAGQRDAETRLWPHPPGKVAMTYRFVRAYRIISCNYRV